MVKRVECAVLATIGEHSDVWHGSCEERMDIQGRAGFVGRGCLRLAIHARNSSKRSSGHDRDIKEADLRF